MGDGWGSDIIGFEKGKIEKKKRGGGLDIHRLR